MGTTPASVALTEYLNTSYEPDRDFVDGILVERHVGSQRHGLLQALLAAFFGQYMKSHRIAVFTATRLQVDAATGRHRVPDLMIVEIPFTRGKVVVDVPAIVVEVKSPEDTFDDIVDRCFEYDRLTVGNIVIIDPDNKRAWLFTNGSFQILTETTIRLHVGKTELLDFPLSQLFAELDNEEQ